MQALLDTATTGAARDSAIPACLGLIAVVGIQREIRAAHPCHVRLRGRIIRIKRGIEPPSLQLEAAGAATVTCCNENRLSLRGGLLEELIFLVHFLLAHVLLTIAPTYADYGRTIFDDTRKIGRASCRERV